MKNKSVLIFDFDGTIADTFHQIIKISNLLAEEFGFKQIRSDEIEELKDKTIVEIIQYLHVPFLKIPQIASRAKKELHKEIASLDVIEGFQEMLKELKKLGHQIGILTSNSSENVKKFLKAHNIDCFDFITSSHRIWTKNKGLDELMAKFDLRQEDIMYIGDETRDIEAAQKAGVKVVAVTWGYNSSKALNALNPDYLIDSPKELIEKLNLAL